MWALILHILHPLCFYHHPEFLTIGPRGQVPQLSGPCPKQCQFLKNVSLDNAVECHILCLKENHHPAWQDGAILSEQAEVGVILHSK